MIIEQSEYRQRRSKVFEKIGNGVAIFRSAPTAVMHNDVDYIYRQDSDFYYLTGYNEPDSIAVLVPYHPDHKYILFVQPKDPLKETWTGFLWGLEGAQEYFGADKVYPIADFAKEIIQYLSQAERIFYHLGRDSAFNLQIISIWQSVLAGNSRRGNGPIALEDTNHIVHPLRQVKSEAELALIRRAISISIEAHKVARESAQVGKYEYEVQADLDRYFRLRGGQGPAYPSIVASGKNSCTLHYVENNAQLSDGDLLLIDAGCSYGYYNGDLTRTFAVNGTFSPEQQAIYDIVLEAQLKAIELVKPGIPYNEVHNQAVEIIVEGLLELGLLIGNKEEIITQGHYKPFYMHNTGHWLGLDVHDAGSYKSNENTWQSLQSGNILTIEPGIYISPNITPAQGQPEIPESWKGIGIRIEDDILINSTGAEVLSADLPK